MTAGLKTCHVDMTHELHEALARCAQAEERSVAATVRLAVKQYLERQEHYARRA